jgi:hypothetical protein
MSSRLSALQPWLQPWAAELIRRAAPYGAIVTSTWRSAAQQAQLYQAHQICQCGYPAAAPGQSLHQLGRAFDVAGSAWLLEAMGELWTSWGGGWGADADPIHFDA